MKNRKSHWLIAVRLMNMCLFRHRVELLSIKQLGRSEPQGTKHMCPPAVTHVSFKGSYLRTHVVTAVNHGHVLCFCPQRTNSSRSSPSTAADRNTASPATERSSWPGIRGSPTPAPAAPAGTGASGVSHSSVRPPAAGFLSCVRASAAHSAWVRVSTTTKPHSPSWSLHYTEFTMLKGVRDSQTLF